MAFYKNFNSARLTFPDMIALLSALRTQDNSIGISITGDKYTVKKSTAFTNPQNTFIQNAIDNIPTLSLQRAAQNEIDNWPISLKALVLALVDEINQLRAALPNPLPPVTPNQALNAIRNKAGNL